MMIRSGRIVLTQAEGYVRLLRLCAKRDTIDVGRVRGNVCRAILTKNWMAVNW